MSPSTCIRIGAIRLWGTTISLAVGLAACGGGSSSPTPPEVAASFAVAKAVCGTGDKQETGLQGQVPASALAGGFKGFNCNVQPTSTTPSVRGEGVFGMFALMRDKSGHVCGYTGGAFEDSFGTSVVDLTDPAKAVETAVLKTPGITNPGEGLKVHEGRGLLIGSYYGNPPIDEDVRHGFDVYDISTDCRHPQLLASTTSLSFSMAGLSALPGTTFQPTERIYGHEGWFAQDGLTFYVSDLPHGVIHAVDVSDPTKPKMLDTYQHPFYGKGYGPAGLYTGTVHGGSMSTDGNRGYFAAVDTEFGTPGVMVPQTGAWYNGFAVVDTSEIQSRKPGGKMKFMTNVVERDGAGAQLTIPVTIKGNKYVINVDEIGGGLINPTGFNSACAAGVTPFSLVHLFYMGDEMKPQLINKLRLEVNDPANCAQVAPDVTANAAAGGFGFLNDVHHCSVDNRDNATTLACGYFLNGIRVYDIRDPRNIKEIAYFVPPAKTANLRWCAAMPILDAKTSSVYSWCADTGVVALKFRNGVWPFPETTTPIDKQL